MGGNIGLLEDGDIIDIDIENGKINARVTEEEFAERRKSYKEPEPKVKSGWLRRYSKLVSPSCKGAIMSDD
jgi:dihydroxy-acid dehydratase